MSRHRSDSGNRKRLYDYGEEWRTVPSSYVSKSISPTTQVAQEKHTHPKPKILNPIIANNIELEKKIIINPIIDINIKLIKNT